VHDVGTVVAMPQLDERLGPDQLGRRDHAHGHAEHVDARRVLEPLIAHRHGAVPGGEDQVEEMLAAEDFCDPALVLDFDGIAEALEALQDARVVARLAQDIEVLGGADDAGIDAERIGAGQQEGEAELRELAQRLRIERLGQRRRRGRFGRGVDGANVADRSGLPCNRRTKWWAPATVGVLGRQSHKLHKVPSTRGLGPRPRARRHARADRTRRTAA
jgi:hypothetical protein